ncbi:PREDICTED: type II inositol 1,4,5-trisphosphate 5-phosphatase, partial [Nicrophorus vespilloides]|uniref:Type II inositol 1,4,5-trisphosphate 5-phosphatase n=1 Tax=Nicrophorus vespilloides TaxID=110193 RepID=A0ABM1MEK7_NICVS
IFVGTWNVNGKAPPTDVENLKRWLNCSDEPPDIYAIGFQELDLSKEAFIFNETVREAEWQKALEWSTHPKAKYRLVGIVRLVGIQLAVMINYTHFEHVSNVAVDYVGTGILGKMGNKGGVAVSFQLHNTTLCFVNCHLAAHVEEVERRNQDYNDINTKINFKRHPQAIKDHDQIYWLGDMNYRIRRLDTHEVKKHIAMGDLNTILCHDQLNQEKERGKILAGFEEGDINFQPTYKYDVNSDRYDSSEKARAPAWTDRIFFKGKGIYQQLYRSFMELKISDHKPVNALFRSEIGIVNREKYRRIHEDLLKSMDKLENEFLPQVTIDSTDVVFDTVKFREPQAKDIIVANTGMVPVDFKFIQKNDEKSYCKEWLRITPFCGRINPGEKSDIRLEINLEQALQSLDDILVLHLEGGKDLFITVSAKCQRSCFTMSVSTLCRCPVPILNLTPEQLKHAENGQSQVLYSVPRELWLLIDFLYRKALKTRDLFESSALHEEMKKIRECLDSGTLDQISDSPYAVAESLLIFLSFTKDPVVPYHLHKRCIEACESFAQCKEILEQFHKLERNVFLYVCMFLQDLLKYSVDNGLDCHGLSIIFGDILMRTPMRNTPKPHCRKKTRFIEQFLTNDLSDLIQVNKQ